MNYQNTNSINDIIKYCRITDPKHEELSVFAFDHSGHAVGTNSHVLLATSTPFDISKAGRTFKNSDFLNGHFSESEIAFCHWKQVLPTECTKKINIKIPSWFKFFDQADESATMSIDYSDITKPFIKITESNEQNSFSFNAKYLSLFAGEEVSILIQGALSSLVILDKNSSIDPLSKFINEEILKEKWFYILMPIKLDKKALEKVYF